MDPKSHTEEDLFQQYLRRQRRWKWIGAGVLALFFIAFGRTVGPRIFGDGKPEKTRVANADLEAARDNMKPSDIKRLEKRAEKSADLQDDSTTASVTSKAGKVLSADEALESKLAPVIPDRDFASELGDLGVEGVIAAQEEEFQDQSSENLREVFVQPRALALKAKEKRLEAVIEGFVAAKTAEEKAAYVIDPIRVLPLMRKFYARERAGSDEVGPLLLRSFYFIQGYEYAIEERVLGDGTGQPLYVGLRNNGGNEFKIDWESMVAYGDLSWDEFFTQRPTEPTLFRCYVVPDNYYNFDYSDQEKWMSFKLINHRTLDSFNAYTERGSEVHQQLMQAFAKRSSAAGAPAPASVMIRVSVAPGTKGNRMAQIDEFLQDTWLVPEPE